MICCQEDALENNGSSRNWNTSFGLRFSTIDIILFLASLCLFTLSESSAMPGLIILIYYFVGGFPIRFFKAWGEWESKIYSRVFFAGTFASSISALYRTYWGDKQGDAFHFYNDSFLESISHLSLETAIPMYSFKAVFDFAQWLNIFPGQYIGVMLNVLIISYCSVITLKSAKIIFGDNADRLRRLILLFSTCGIFALFAGLLVRDSFALLGITVLIHIWLYFLEGPIFSFRFFLVLASSLLANKILIFVRQELIYVPIGMALAGGVALFVSEKKKNNKILKLNTVGSFFLLLIGGSVLTYYFGPEILQSITRNQNSYQMVTRKEGTSNSLGWLLVVNQPLPLKAFLGSVYLLLFPIPVWVGFQTKQVYHLFKSLNAIYMAFIIPLALMAFYEILQKRLFTKPSIAYLVFLFLGFTASIAITSLETRHHGTFYTPLLLLALIPDLRPKKTKQLFFTILFIYLTGYFSIHVLWSVLKLS